MQRIMWLKYKGKKVLFADYSGAPVREILEVFDKFNKFVAGLNEKILVLTDFNNIKIDKIIIQRLKDADSKMSAKKFKKAAVLGIEGVKKTLLNFYNAATGSKVKACTNKQEALDWLVKSVGKSDLADESFLEQ